MRYLVIEYDIDFKKGMADIKVEYALNFDMIRKVSHINLPEYFWFLERYEVFQSTSPIKIGAILMFRPFLKRSLPEF